jgi:hypothetical protein
VSFYGETNRLRPEGKLDAENTLWAAFLGIKGFLSADSAKNSALISSTSFKIDSFFEKAIFCNLTNLKSVQTQPFTLHTTDVQHLFADYLFILEIN